MYVMRVVADVGLSDGFDAADAVFWLSGILTALTLWALIRGFPMWRRICDFFHWWEKFRDDWDGQPARPDRARIPGIPERLNDIDGEFKRNSGSTLKDTVHETNRIVQGLEGETRRVADELKESRATITARLDSSEEVRHAILEVSNQNLAATQQAFIAAGLQPPQYVPIPVQYHTHPKEDTTS